MEIATIALEELRLVHGTEYTYGNIAETICKQVLKNPFQSGY